jgi:hypothetical protein
MSKENVLSMIEKLISDSRKRETESRCGYDRSREKGIRAGLRMVKVMVDLKGSEK